GGVLVWEARCACEGEREFCSPPRRSIRLPEHDRAVRLPDEATASGMGQTMSAQQEGMSTRTEVLKASPPMFESRWLDACSRVHPSVPVILFAPAIAILMTLGIERVGAVGAVAWALGGYVFWTLTEYWMHRIVFHFEPEDGIGARLHWIIHGVHHD